MSEAKNTFDVAIKDAEELLEHFNRINSKPPPDNAEVLKRAGLIMAFTAWETYVEDRVKEGLEARLDQEGDGLGARFLKKKLDEELKRFNNPNSEKTRKLLLDFLEIDVFKKWAWNNFDTEKVRTMLDQLITRRGEAVHRSKPKTSVQPAPHLVTKDELKRAIGFLRSLVDATEQAFN